MMKLLALLCVLVASQAKNLDPEPSIYGEFKLIYSWPKLDLELPNCNPVLISAADPPRPAGSCSCGRPSANVNVIKVQSRSRQFTVLADLVSEGEELKQAMSDKCSCAGESIDHSVVLRLSGGYMLHFDTNISKGFLLGGTVPTAEQLQDIISSLPLNAKDGSLVCQ